MKYLLIAVLVILLLGLLVWQFGLSHRDRKLVFASPITIDVNGEQRQFYVNAADAANPPEALFIGLHGFTDSPRRFGYYTSLHNVVGDRDLVIYPKAAKPKINQRSGWNAGFCCGSGWAQGRDDVAFISKIARDFKIEYDGVPVYLVGFSNGGMMVQRLLAEEPDAFDGGVASGSSAGLQNGKQLSPTSSDVRLLLMHGERDKTVKFGGGAAMTEPDFPWLSFEQTSEIWREVIGDNLTTKTYPELKHRWPDWRILRPWHTQPEGTQRAVEFLKNR